MIVQKAVTPQMSSSYLRRCQDTVSGYVTNLADTVDITSPAELYNVLGLGYPGSPHRPNAPYLDVLRFESTELMAFSNAIGGRTPEEAHANDGPFVEHPPFSGLGFTVGGNPPVPLWFLDHCRLPPGAELWRIHANGQEELLAMYSDVGLGWQGANGPLPVESRVLPSLMIGPLVKWQDVTWPADLIDGGTVVLASAGEPPMGGFTRTARGYWRREVPLDEVGEYYDLQLHGTWRGARFRIVHRWEQRGRMLAELFYIGRNALEAEALGLTKLDAGVYAGSAPISELTDVQGLQNTPSPLSAHAPE